MALNIEKANGEALSGTSQQAGTEASARPAMALPWEGIVRSCTHATQALSDVLQQFWSLPIRLQFFGASQKSHYFWRTDDFHVSQLMLGDAAEEPPAMALLRLSDAACSDLLTQALGPRPVSGKQFSFRQLSPLEANILNEFSRDVLAALMKTVIKKPSRTIKADPVHLIWVVQAETAPNAEPGELAGKKPLQFREPAEIGKIILTLPPQAVRTETLTPTPDTEVPDTFFFHVKGDARLYLGSTRMTLADLNQLESDDVVVLENSDNSRMAIVEPASGENLFFSCEIPQKQRLMMPYAQEFSDMETQQAVPAKQNLWDNLMIEVNAEFEPIKLPLKQLKQMSEGLVVEIGDLIHNRICLQVEGKTLARGELIIVGDKFGIRISQVDAAESQTTPQPSAETPQNMPPSSPDAMETPPAEMPAPGADNDQNLDNFLNDDFEDFEDFDDDDL